MKKCMLVAMLCIILAGCVGTGDDEGGLIVDPLEKEENKVSGWLAGGKDINDSTKYFVGITFTLEPRDLNGILDGFVPWVEQVDCDRNSIITYPNDQLGQDNFWTDGELYKTLNPLIADGHVLIVNWTRNDSLECRYFFYEDASESFVLSQEHPCQ